MWRIDTEWVVTAFPVGGSGPFGPGIGPVCPGEDDLGGGDPVGENLRTECQHAVRERLPHGLHVPPELVVALQRDTPRKLENDIGLLVGQESFDVASVDGGDVAVEDLLQVGLVVGHDASVVRSGHEPVHHDKGDLRFSSG